MTDRSKPQEFMDQLIRLLERAELSIEDRGVDDGTWDRRDVVLVEDADGQRFQIEVRRVER